MSTAIHHQPVPRNLRAEGEQQFAAESDSAQERMKVVFRQPAGREDAPLLDEVFGAYLKTNLHEGVTYTFDMVLDNKEKRYFHFDHAGIRYLATLYVYRGPEGRTVVLKLPNNGFSYLAKYPGEDLYRHNRPGWVALPVPEAIAEFPTMQRVVSPRYSQAIVFYNFDAQRIDMKFAPRKPTDPRFMVTFEPGRPCVNEDDMWQPF